MLETFRDLSKANLIPFLIGIYVSLIISLDPFISNYLPLKYLKSIPYSFTITVFILTICLYLIYINSEKIWEKIIPILLVSLIIGDQTKGLTGKGADLADLVVLSAFIIWLIKNFMNEDSRVKWSKFDLLILGLILLAFLSESNTGRISYFRLAKGLKCFGVAFIVVKLITTKDDLYFFIKSLIIIISVSAILGILQELLYLQTGIIFPPTKEIFLAVNTQVINGVIMLRISAFAGITQDFANILAATLSITLFLLLSPIIRDRKRYTLLLIAFLLIFTALYLTFARAAWLAFAVTALIALFFRRPSYSIHFIMALLSILLLCYVTGILDIINNFLYEEISLMGKLGLRNEMNKLGIEASLARHPFIGRGIERSNIYMSNPYRWPPHNTFVQVLAEIGIIGFSIYLSMLLYLIFRLFMVIITVKGSNEKAIATSLLMGLFTLTIYSQFDPDFLRLFPWIYFGLTESAILILGEERQKTLQS